MRNDIDKIIHERGHVRRSRVRRKGYSRQESVDMEDLPSSQGMRHGRSDVANPDVHLSPLRRWLQKQVGRPWSQVYSDISKNSTIKCHRDLKYWLECLVSVDVWMINNVPHEKRASMGHYFEVLPNRSEFALFVHPDTGLLCKYKPAKVACKPTPAPKLITISEISWSANRSRIPAKPHGLWENLNELFYRTAYRQIKGIWYFTTEWVDHSWRLYRDNDDRYHYVSISKRQLSSKELKKLNLTNDLLANAA